MRTGRGGKVRAIYLYMVYWYILILQIHILYCIYIYITSNQIYIYMYKSGRQLGIWKGTSHVILSFALSLPQNYHLIPSPVLSYPFLPYLSYPIIHLLEARSSWFCLPYLKMIQQGIARWKRFPWYCNDRSARRHLGVMWWYQDVFCCHQDVIFIWDIFFRNLL